MTKRGFGSAAGIVIASLVVGVLGGAGGAALYMRNVSPGTGGGGTTPPPLPPRSVHVTTDQDAIVTAVAAADPGVVKIVATHLVEPTNPFDYFFGGGRRVERGIGSGFMFDYEGRKLILTNTHVVGEAQDITVKLTSGQQLPGKLLGADRASDVAVVALEGEAESLPTVGLGNSDELRIGEWVVAIGHPYEFEHTVTVGVVSAQGYRPTPDATTGQTVSRNVIQTDAAINAGNSGGPLVNLAGEVVGINSMIYSPTGATVGIGFAIPINDAKEVVHFLIHRGPWIGVAGGWANSQGLAQYLGLKVDHGVVVVGIAPNSPASQAGMQRGDVILSIDGQPVNNTDQLRQAIFKRNIGDVIKIEVQRGDSTMELSVTAGKVPREYYQ